MNFSRPWWNVPTDRFQWNVPIPRDLGAAPRFNVRARPSVLGVLEFHSAGRPRLFSPSPPRAECRQRFRNDGAAALRGRPRRDTGGGHRRVAKRHVVAAESRPAKGLHCAAPHLNGRSRRSRMGCVARGFAHARRLLGGCTLRRHQLEKPVGAERASRSLAPQREAETGARQDGRRHCGCAREPRRRPFESNSKVGSRDRGTRSRTPTHRIGPPRRRRGQNPWGRSASFRYQGDPFPDRELRPKVCAMAANHCGPQRLVRPRPVTAGSNAWFVTSSLWSMVVVPDRIDVVPDRIRRSLREDLFGAHVCFLSAQRWKGWFSELRRIADSDLSIGRLRGSPRRIADEEKAHWVALNTAENA